ncbi:hypothetical protein KY317_03365 [Candidatus Woesearchaeota archaeon]|nr:hypothetical protein [Candidatus Woesearchaeota archaeon]
MKHLKFTAIAIILIVLIIPFYSADVYAGSLIVTKSTGSSEIDNYFDGLGDSWVIEVEASLGGAAVTKDMVKAQFDSPEYFHSCTPSGGSYKCVWESGLFSSEEDVFSVDVILTDAGQTFTDTAEIIVDKTSPSIVINRARQRDDIIEIDVSVNDGNTETSSLIDRIEFYSGAMLIDTITNINKIEYSGTLDLDIPKTGTYENQVIIVKAYDRLGHEGVVQSSEFSFDLGAPVIHKESFRIGNIVSDYAPSVKTYFDISVDITEAGQLKKVAGDFSDLGAGVSEAGCSRIGDTNVHHCIWANMYVSIDGPVDITITAEDVNDNMASETISKLYSVDNIAPDIEFIGTTAHYNEKSYVIRNEENILRVELREAESGISAENIRMNAINVNPLLDDYLPADKCEQTEDDSTLWECTWEIMVKKEGTIILVDAPDNAGNELPSSELAQKNRIFLAFDSEMPEFIDASVTSLGGLLSEEKPYLQSKDFIRIEARASDNIGIRGFADLTDITTEFGERVEADRCTKNEGIWTCVWDGIGPVANGYIKNAPIRLVFEDFVGNVVSHTEFVEILATAGDLDYPDYWNMGDIENYPDAIDRQTTNLIGHRMYFQIPLESGNKNVRILSTSIRSCAGEHLADYYLINNQADSKDPYLVLQLEKFAGDVNSLNYECELNIFSRYLNKAIEYPEIKKINITMPFYNLPLGQQGHALVKKIDNKKHQLKTGYYGTIGALNEVVKYGRLACKILEIWEKIKQVFGILTTASDVLRAYPPTKPVAVTTCNTAGTVSTINKEIVGKKEKFGLKMICDIITCRKAALVTDAWHDKVLTSYANFKIPYIGSYRTLLGEKAKPNPYDNLLLSVLTVCIPGIVYNLEKDRQVECRYLYCLEKEVPAGVATIGACDELLRYQKCKYVTGEFFHIFPPTAAVDLLLNKIKSIITDPIGLFNLALTELCHKLCKDSGGWYYACSIQGWLTYALDLANDLVAVESMARTIRHDYCAEVL